MKKTIDVSRLEIGMYVVELDRPWIGTPFMFQGFTISTPEELDTLRGLCRQVTVEETTQAEPKPPLRKPILQPIKKEEPKTQEGYTKILWTEPTAANRRRYPETVPFGQELGPAREVVEQARTTVFTIMDDARLGHAIDTAAVKATVSGLVDSAIRNPDALMCFNQLKKRDEYTAMHSLRVCVLALAFGRHLDLTRESLYRLGIGALLHDIGKMRVPLDILNKPAKLTEDEFEIMKQHVPEGVRLLEKSDGIPAGAIDVVSQHHERYAGRGYAHALQGNAITLFGQIGAIADCYDAITSDRVYHDGMTPTMALANMYARRAHDFHQTLVEEFIRCMGIYPIGSIVELSDGEVGVVLSHNRKRNLKPQVVLALDADKKPLPKPIITDLSREEARDPKAKGPQGRCIVHVLEGTNLGINPADFMPKLNNQ